MWHASGTASSHNGAKPGASRATAQVCAGSRRNIDVPSTSAVATKRQYSRLWNVVAVVWIVAVGIYFLVPRATAHDRIPAPPGPYVLDGQIRDAGALIGLGPDVLTKLR